MGIRMKRAILTLSIAMLLFITPCFGVSSEQLTTVIDEPLSDPVPTWNIGDSWTYTIHDVTTTFNIQGQLLSFDGNIDEFTWTVSSDSGSYYTLDITGILNGEFQAHLTSMIGSVYISGPVYPKLSRLTGTILFSKDNLEFHSLDAEIIGLTLATTDLLPIPIPFPYKATLDIDSTPDLPLYDFPLSGIKFWSLPATDLTSSIILGDIFHLATFPLSIYTELPFIPLPLAFFCANPSSTNVDAGTFDAYKISIPLYGGVEYYYAPEVKNLIKFDIQADNSDFRGELTSYSIA